jgi:hypothetical protein
MEPGPEIGKTCGGCWQRRRTIGTDRHPVNGRGHVHGRLADPADIAIRPAVNQVDAAVPGMPEHQDRSPGHVELLHRLADRKPLQRGREFHE